MVDRARRLLPRGLAVFMAALAVALLVYQELLSPLSGTGFGDYQAFHHNWEFGRVAIARYGELPLWDPYYCGGIPDWGDPQSQIHHPLFFLSFLFGTTIALKIFVLAHATAGFAGMYVFARHVEKLAAPAAALAAGAWAGSGFFAWHCGCGHSGFLAFYLMPWVLIAWRRAIADFRFSAAVAALLTLGLLAGGAYVFPYMLLILAFDSAVRAFDKRERRGILIAIATGSVMTVLLGAWRLIPILAHLRIYGRKRDTVDKLDLRELLDLLTRDASGASAEHNVQNHPYTWVEYGAYVGWGTVLLALAGAILAVRFRSRRWLIVGLVVFGSLTLGSFARVSPWNLLQKLPIYGSLQAPSRFLFAFVFFLALLAAVAIDRAIERLAEYGVRAPRLSGAIGWLAAIVVFVPIAVHHRDVLVDKWDQPPVPSGRVQESFFLSFLPHYLERRAFPPGASLPQNNHGTGHCYTGMDYFPASGLWSGPSAQVRISEPGRLEGWGRTTRTVWADVDLPAGGHVVFNQTQAPGWRSEFGPPKRDQNRASLDVPPGRRRVLLRYQPPSLPWALSASLVGLALAVSMASRRATDFLTGSKRRVLVFGLALTGFGFFAYLRGVFAPEPSARVAQVSRLTATASATSEQELHSHYAPGKAVDGDPKTEWLARDHEEAWLDVRVEPAVSVKAVALLNARNLPFDDRAAQKFRIEAYLGPRLVATAEDSFGPKSAQPSWRYVPIEADSADRIRVVVQTWSGLGGGIAEVRVF